MESKSHDDLMRRLYGDDSGVGYQRVLMEDSGKVYFVQAVSGGAVKIGTTSRSLDSRLAQLQTSHPETLRLIGWLPGGRGVESKLHSAFADDNIRGEWFRDSPRLMEFVEAYAEPPWED